MLCWGIVGTLALARMAAQTTENVLLVVNQASNVSRRIAEYYVHKRAIPLANVCPIQAPADEEISWEVYRSRVERPVAACLQGKKLTEKILYIVTTLGVPLRVPGPGDDMIAETASVDSELTLLYAKLHGSRFGRPGVVRNPFFGRTFDRFEHSRFQIYLVTRLAAYDFADVKAMIDRSTLARNQGVFVFDLNANDIDTGNDWLRAAAAHLPANRVVLDTSKAVLYGQKNVIGYASWGSNDKNRHERNVGFEWLPGAIVTDYVSTNARTFRKPPDGWRITTWKDTAHFFADSPQSLSADYLHEGATGAAGHVNEPFLIQTPRPDHVFPAYFNGRNLAESYYLGIPSLSWQNVVLGDPLCRIGRP